MEDERLKKDFEFLRDNLRQIALLITEQKYVEANFMIGCLYQLCNFNYYAYIQKEKQNDENRL